MASLTTTVSSNMAIPEFVRKLFRMLDDPTSFHVVSWYDNGDAFIVKDPNEFSREVLPRHFKHNNFASFVRQLNKYDFHKVKNPDSKQRGISDQSWIFQHPSFTRHSIESLANIKRKTPTQKAPGSPTGTRDSSDLKRETEELHQQVESLQTIQRDMADYLQTLSRNYETVVRELVSFKKNLQTQDNLMQNLLQYLVNKESTDNKRLSAQDFNSEHPSSSQLAIAAPPASSGSSGALSRPPSTGTGVPMWSPNELPQLAAVAAESSKGFLSYPEISQASLSTLDELGRLSRSASTAASADAISASQNENLTVCTVGMLRPRASTEGSSMMQDNATGTSTTQGNSLRVYRSTFVPSWSVPPKVLLVEDDAMCRMVASKLLQVFGCSYEIAHDGVEAVNKMNLEKYDLVLMDIVMPNMDGISATTQIRQFDPATPVISMTANTSRDDCLTYLATGMNDILPKPFSKDTLFAMLERYCAHLKPLWNQQLSNFNNSGVTITEANSDESNAQNEENTSNKRIKME